MSDLLQYHHLELRTWIEWPIDTTIAVIIFSVVTFGHTVDDAHFDPLVLCNLIGVVDQAILIIVDFVIALQRVSLCFDCELEATGQANGRFTVTK